MARRAPLGEGDPTGAPPGSGAVGDAPPTAGPATAAGTVHGREVDTGSAPQPAARRAAPDVAVLVTRRQAAIGVAVLAVLSAVLAVVAARVLYPLYSPNLDDVVYVAQAKLLAAGHLTIPAADAAFFQPYLSGIRGDRVVFIYSPMWAGVLAASQLAFGTTLVALPVVAASGVAATYAFGRELFPDRDRLVPLLATALFALSPMAVLLSATYLSYHVGAVIAIVAGWLLLRGLRTGSRWSFAGAGAAFGASFFGRPFDTVLLALPFAVYAVVLHRRRLRALAAPATWLVLGAVPFLVLTAAVNAHLMGSPLSFPQNVAGSYNRFGFGPRKGFAYGPSDVGSAQVFTLGRSLHVLWLNLVRSPRWVFGSLASVLAAGYAVVRWRRDPRTWLLVALVAVFPLGYVFWWGSYNATITYGITRQLGPFYYHPSLAPLTLLAACGLVGALRGRRPATVGAVAVAGVALVAAGMVAPLRESRASRDRRRADEAMVLRAVPERDALVFLPGTRLLIPFPTLANDPGRTGERLYAVDRDAENLELMDRYPRREPWVVHSAFPAGANIFEADERFSVHPLTVRSTGTLTRAATLTVRTLQPYALAYVRAGREVRSVVLPPAPRGRYRLTVTLSAPGRGAGAAAATDSTSPAARPGDGSAEVGPDGVVRMNLTVPEAPRHATMAFGVGFGSTPDLGSANRFEYRYAYRTAGDGTMTVVQLARPYHQIVFPGHAPVWVSQEVDDVVRLDGRGRR